MPDSIDGLGRRVSRLEERDKVIDGRIQNIHSKLDTHKDLIDNDMKGIRDLLTDIQKGQHSQELVNQKMDFTLTSINQNREDERRSKEKSDSERKSDMKQIKWFIYGLGGTIGTSLLVSLIRMWFGI